MHINGNIWLEDESGFMLGKGKAHLLLEIDKTGSIAQAAQHLGISYRKAWGMVQQLNKTHGSPLVTKKAGGRSGGFTLITAAGKQRIKQFFDAQADFEDYLSAAYLPPPNNE